MKPTTLVKIDFSALQHNLLQVKHFAPNSRVMAVIKANAYGHGLVDVAKALSAADAFCVNYSEDAVALREAGIQQRILLLQGFYSAEELVLLSSLDCEVVLHHKQQLVMLLDAQLKKPVKVWININTGLNRLGVSPDDVETVYQALTQSANVSQPVNVMTHFSHANHQETSRNKTQLDCFNRVAAHFPGEKSLSKSAAVIDAVVPDADWVRPGIMLYGVSPFEGKLGQEFNLKPVMTVTSEIVAVRHQKKGDAVGYSGLWVCPENMPVGIVRMGYSSGYPAQAQNGTPILVNGKRCALVGRVSMDMLAVDLRACSDAKVGDRVTLWGQGLPVEVVAQHANTMPYVLLSNIKYA